MLLSGEVKHILRKHKYLEPKKIGEGSFGKAILVEGEDGTSLICKVVDVSSASPKEAPMRSRRGDCSPPSGILT